jgi:hypothetical protein
MPDGEAISNHWVTAKKAGKGTMAAGGAVINAAQHFSGASAVALATGAAAASATGIGLVVGGAAITVATCGLSAYSAYKTGKHLEVLEKIHERRHIADDVLPYIILQKAEKQARKAVGAVPMAGSAVTAVYSLGRNLYKRAKGTLGEKRTAMATDLTKHFLTHDCGLAQAIVAELYSFEEMLWLCEQDPQDVIKLIARKMTSN